MEISTPKFAKTENEDIKKETNRSKFFDEDMSIAISREDYMPDAQPKSAGLNLNLRSSNLSHSDNDSEPEVSADEKLGSVNDVELQGDSRLNNGPRASYAKKLEVAVQNWRTNVYPVDLNLNINEITTEEIRESVITDQKIDEIINILKNIEKGIISGEISREEAFSLLREVRFLYITPLWGNPESSINELIDKCADDPEFCDKLLRIETQTERTLVALKAKIGGRIISSEINEVGNGSYSTVFLAKTADGREIAFKPCTEFDEVSGESEFVATAEMNLGTTNAGLCRRNFAVNDVCNFLKRRGFPYTVVGAEPIIINDNPGIGMPFIQGDTAAKYFENNKTVITSELLRDYAYIQIQDVFIGNIDRNAGNVMIYRDKSSGEYRAIGIDNDETFPTNAREGQWNGGKEQPNQEIRNYSGDKVIGYKSISNSVPSTLVLVKSDGTSKGGKNLIAVDGIFALRNYGIPPVIDSDMAMSIREVEMEKFQEICNKSDLTSAEIEPALSRTKELKEIIHRSEIIGAGIIDASKKLKRVVISDRSDNISKLGKLSDKIEELESFKKLVVNEKNEVATQFENLKNNSGMTGFESEKINEMRERLELLNAGVENLDKIEDKIVEISEKIESAKSTGNLPKNFDKMVKQVNEAIYSSKFVFGTVVSIISPNEWSEDKVKELGCDNTNFYALRHKNGLK